VRARERLLAGVGAINCTDAVLETLLESVTVSCTVYVPAVAKMWVGLTPVAVLPSPKFHA
jgi:hypothetical protein